jgi:hypothetical protein
MPNRNEVAANHGLLAHEVIIKHVYQALTWVWEVRHAGTGLLLETLE